MESNEVTRQSPADQAATRNTMRRWAREQARMDGFVSAREQATNEVFDRELDAEVRHILEID